MDVTKIITLIGIAGAVRGGFIAYDGWTDRTAAGDEPIAKKKATTELVNGLILMGVSGAFAAAMAIFISGAIKF